jgi:hypothetical protein
MSRKEVPNNLYYPEEEPMNPKPGIRTTEHFAAIVSQVLTMLALFGFISQNDTQTLEEAITKGIAAVFIFVANAAVVVHYIKSRLHLKSGAQANGVSNGGSANGGSANGGSANSSAANGDQDSQVSKAISSGLILLAVLSLFGGFAGPAQAQYVLPFRNSHEQRLKALEQRLANPPQTAPAPQAPAPQIIYHPYPVQPPLQAFPIQGQPQQAFPIQGQPLQGFPIQGHPLQGLPIQGQPQQTLPVPGPPKQVFPQAPQAPQAPPQAPPQTPPGPAAPNHPAAPPQQSLPVAPPRPAPSSPPVGPPAPNAPAPNTGPVPYSTRLVHALYRLEEEHHGTTYCFRLRSLRPAGPLQENRHPDRAAHLRRAAAQGDRRKSRSLPRVLPSRPADAGQ